MNVGKNQMMSIIEFIETIDQISTSVTSVSSSQNVDSKIILCISYILRDICAENVLFDDSSVFDHKPGRRPSVSVDKYLTERIMKYMKASVDHVIIALVLIDKIGMKHHMCVTERNIHRLIAIALTEIIKFNDDRSYLNSYYTKVAGLPIEEFNYLEILFLKLLDFDVWVHDDIIQEYKNHLLTIAEKM